MRSAGSPPCDRHPADVLEVSGIPAPVQVDGIAHRPIEGVSLAYTFDKSAGGRDAPSRHRTQYFEMAGVQGRYSDGWILSAVPLRAPWQLATAAVTDPATAFKYELYDTKNDWTQYTDVAAKHEKVKEMTGLMFGEFAKTRCCRSTPRRRHGSSRRVQHGGGQDGLQLLGHDGDRHSGRNMPSLLERPTPSRPRSTCPRTAPTA